MPPLTAKSSEHITKEDYELIAEFRYALRKFLGFSEATAIENKVTPHQYQALLAIQGFPGRNWATIGELAEQLCTAHHSAVGMVDRLEALQLVRRSKSGEDRRRVQVALTDKGLVTLEKLYHAHRAELRNVGPKLAALVKKLSETGVVGNRRREFFSPACSLPEIED